jgi:proliferating cell nuclear antigen PCNA
MDLECHPGTPVLARILHAAYQITCEDINISFTEQGLQFQGMDSAHVSLVTVYIPAETFARYHLLTNATVTLGVHLPVLCHVLSRATKHDTIRLCTTATMLECHLVCKDQHRIFQLSTLDLDTVVLDVPTIPYDTSLTFPVQQLQTTFQDLALFGDDVRIQCTEHGITMSTTGTKGTGSVTFPQVSKTSSLLTFSLQYLRLFTKTPISTVVHVHLAPDQPILCMYNVHGSEIRFYLAPKLDDEQD